MSAEFRLVVCGCRDFSDYNLLSNELDFQYVAVWTDNRYIYKVDISVFDFDPEYILKAIMESLVDVDTIS